MTKPNALLRYAASFGAQKQCCVILTILLFVAYGCAWAQEKRSLPDPDAIAGRWEAPDGQGGAVGMNIIITTHIDGAPTSIAGHVQYEDELIAGIYQRTGQDVEPLGFNFFSSAAGGGMIWDGHHLAIHLAGKGDFPKVNLDLIWHEESQTWSGLFERGSFREQVSLKRPTSTASKSPFVGTWSDKAGMMNNCLHISQEKDGALTAWSDDLQTPGRMRYANGIQPPTQTMEHYGEIAKAKMDAPDQITVELRAYTAMCCSHPFTAKLSTDGQSLFGSFARRAGPLSAILLLCSAPPAKLLGQDVGSSSGSVFHIHGVVLNALTNKPVGRALVTSTEMAAMTDSEGRFEFDVRLLMDNSASGAALRSRLGVPGSGGGGFPMALIARRPGYLMQRPTMLLLRDKSPEGPGLKIKIMPESILRGRLATSGEAPPIGVQVQLFRKQVQDGLANWGQVASAQTNSRGEYRFADLPAGDYKVMTREWVENESTVPVPPRQMTGYPPAYYPNELNLAKAAPIHIAAGETAQAELNLRARPYYRVSIPVMNVPHGTGVNVTVGEEDGSSGFSLGFNSQTQKIEGLLPNGAYDVRVMSFGQVQSAGAGRIEIAGGPVQGAPISLVSSGVIPVVVREEYTADSDTGTREGLVFSRIGNGRQRSLELILRPVGTNGPTARLRNPNGKGNEDLVVENAREGKYRVWVMPNRGYVASATSGGVDLLHKPLVVGAGGASAPIEITLRDDTATLDGTVSPIPPTGGEPNPYGGVSVFCFPIESGVGRLVQGFAGVDGTFSMQNLPPGRYLVLAFPTPYQNLEYRNEEVLRQYESKGTIVTLEAGQRAEVKVSVLTEDEE